MPNVEAKKLGPLGQRLGLERVQARPFVLSITGADGQRRRDLARAVIDASTWTTPNPLGAGGVPADGEAALADRIIYGIPDVLGRDCAFYAGRTTLVLGAGHLAANVLLDLARLTEREPATTLSGAVGLIAAGLILLWSGFPAVAAALILYGAGNGVFSIARGTLPLALFGPDRYAGLMGCLAMPSLLAQALAPLLGAFVIERAGVGETFGLLALIAVLNVALWAAPRRVES